MIDRPPVKVLPVAVSVTEPPLAKPFTVTVPVPVIWFAIVVVLSAPGGGFTLFGSAKVRLPAASTLIAPVPTVPMALPSPSCRVPPETSTGPVMMLF